MTRYLSGFKRERSPIIVLLFASLILRGPAASRERERERESERYLALSPLMDRKRARISARRISERIEDREIRRCTENRTKMGNIYPRLRALQTDYPNAIQPLADVTNASVTHPITGSPSIYEVLALLGRAMGRQARARGARRNRKEREKERERERGREREGGRERNVLSLTLHRFPLVAPRPAKNLGQHDSRGLSKDGETESRKLHSSRARDRRPFPDGNEIVPSSGRLPPPLLLLLLLLLLSITRIDGVDGSRARESAHGIA